MLKLFFILFLSIQFSLIGLTQVNYKQFKEFEKEDFCSKAHSTYTFKNNSTNPALKDYNITLIKIDIETDNTSSFITGFALLNGEVVVSEMDVFVVELGTQMTVDSVLFNNESAGFSHNADELSVTMSGPLGLGSNFSVIVYYHGDGHSSSNYAGGMHHTTFDNRELTYTFTQPFGASLWFPCKQDLTDKIDTLQMHITVPSSVKVASNGVLRGKVNLGNEKTRFEWETNHPIAYYLVVFNVYDYVEYNFYAHPDNFEDSIYIQNFMIDDAHVSLMKNEIDQTSDAMNLYCNLFGMYPFQDEKYGHAIWGHGFGMEHQTLTSMPYDIDFRRLSHELSHQWFGDLVTCASWQDIWLNEGFASYFDYLALKSILSDEDGEDRMEYYHSRAMEAPDGSVYVPASDANNASRIFNYRLSYCKGASVVKMLRFEVQNDELFWQSLKNYLDIYKNKSASTDDLKEVFEETCNRDFSYFFDQWIYGEGYPAYNGTWFQQNDTLYLNVYQNASKSSVTPFFKMLLEFKLFHDDGDSLIVLNQDEKSKQYKVHLPFKVNFLLLDPKNEVLNKNNGFSKISSAGEITLAPVQAFPNPFSQNLIVRNYTDTIVTFEGTLYNSNGKELRYFKTTESEYEMDTSELSPAIYFLKIVTSNGTFIQKVIKY